jgi:3-hydroxyisobutyrate dehydrogenase-like beta-hydroxyacid dehydrogenase
VLETDREDMQNHEHICFFSAAHAFKDRGIALELARNLNVELPLAHATKDQYDRMTAKGLRDRHVRHRRTHVQKPSQTFRGAFEETRKQHC